MRVSFKWVVLWSLWLARLVRQPTTPVRVTGGVIQGEVAHDGSHKRYLAIPYATQGLHRDKRFQAPGPEPTWQGTFNAIETNVRCLQILYPGTKLLLGQEDCLVLNVLTPLNTSPDSKLPVMVFIHGGGFLEGSGTTFMYGPKFLTEKGVILVTLNYRLNVHGFLCLGIKEAPGNAGMKDQVAALKWVQRNIKAFGGDPDNVTIFGESAGAASVSYHVVSPMSKGLFHKAILQSGSSIASWAYQETPLHYAKLLAKSLGKDLNDPHEIYDLLNGTPLEELIRTVIPIEEGETVLNSLKFSPCSEVEMEDVDPFLTKNPYELLSKGKFNRVPMIIGTNDQEGIFFAGLDKNRLQSIDFGKSLPKNLFFPSVAGKDKVVKEVKEMYLGDDVKISQFYGEPFFNYPALAETELLMKFSDQPIYNYLFKYSGWRNFPKFTAGFPLATVPGASHADDFFYIFEQPFAPKTDWNMIDRMTNLWTNFAKYGVPTTEDSIQIPHWQKTLSVRPSVYVLDREISTEPLWHAPSLHYWHELYSRHRR